MRIIIFICLFGFFSKADSFWFKIQKMDCHFMNGASLQYTMNFPDVAFAKYGLYNTKYSVDSKLVVRNIQNAQQESFWTLKDSFSNRYSLKFSAYVNPSLVHFDFKNVSARMESYVPVMASVWFPVTKPTVIATGTCSFSVSKW